MLANFLDKTKPIIFVLLVAFFFLFSFSKFFFETSELVFNLDLGLAIATNIVLYGTIFFLYNFIIGKNELTYDNAYSFFLYILLSLCLTDDILNTSIPLLIFVQLLFLRKLYSLKSSKNVLKKLFDAGFWLAILVLIEPMFIGFSILLFIGIFLHQKITINTILAPVFGFLAPVLILYAYYLWVDYPGWESHWDFSRYSLEYRFYIEGKIVYFIGLISLLIGTTFILKSPFTLTFKNTFRKNWLLLTFHLVIVSTSIAFLPEKTNFELTYMLFPATIIMANGVELISDRLYRNVFIVAILLFFFGYNFVL